MQNLVDHGPQTVLRSTFKYRAYNLAVYGIELPMIKPWSSRPSIIDTVLTLFDLTSKCVESTPGSRTHVRDKEPLSQLPPLAGVLFECIKERLDWLSRYMIHASFPFLSDRHTRQVVEMRGNVRRKSFNKNSQICDLRSLKHYV